MAKKPPVTNAKKANEKYTKNFRLHYIGLNVKYLLLLSDSKET
jgi:hypothetical protein